MVLRNNEVGNSLVLSEVNRLGIVRRMIAFDGGGVVFELDCDNSRAAAALYNLGFAAVARNRAPNLLNGLATSAMYGCSPPGR
jgi:hypothetical protein